MNPSIFRSENHHDADEDHKERRNGILTIPSRNGASLLPSHVLLEQHQSLFAGGQNGFQIHRRPFGKGQDMQVDTTAKKVTSPACPAWRLLF